MNFKNKTLFYTYLLQCIVVVTLGTASYFIITDYYQKSQEKLTLEIANSNIAYAEQLVAEKGILRMSNGLMYAGDFLINNSDDIVNKVTKNTQFGCTIFQMNKRISTTAKVGKNDKSAIGTFANEEVTKLVLDRGLVFKGITNTIGKKWIIICKPLSNPQNQIIGMIAVFREYNQFLGNIGTFKSIIAVAMVLCSFTIILIMGYSYKRAVKLSVRNELLNDNVKSLSEHQSEFQKLSFIAKEIKQNIAVIDIDDNVEWVNPAFMESFKYSEKEIIGNKLSMLISGPRTNMESIKKLNDYIFKYKKPLNIDLEQYRKDGSHFWTKVFVSPILDSKGNLEKHISISQDISEEYEANSKLIKAQNQFSEIGRTIEDVFYLYNKLEQKYEYISPHCQQILGVSAEVFYEGKSRGQIAILEEDRSKLLNIQNQVENGKLGNAEFRIIIDNKIKWIKERSYPIFDANGKVVKISALCTDITESKEIKEEIELNILQTKLLAKIGLEITECRSIEEITNNLYIRVNELMDALKFSIGVIDEEKRTLKFPLFIDQEDILLDSLHNLDENILGCICANTGKEIIIQDLLKDFSKYTNKVLDSSSVDRSESIIYLPLFVKKKVIGVITVQSKSKNAYSQRQIDLLKNLSAYLPNSIENILLNISLENQVKLRTEEIIVHKNKLIEQHESNFLLSEIGVNLSSSLDFEYIFDTLHSNIMKMMDAEMFGIRIINNAKKSLEYKFEIESGNRHPSIEVPLNGKKNLTTWSIKNKQSIFINDYDKECVNYVDKVDIFLGKVSQSIILCPMIVDGKVLGVISVQSFKKNAYTKTHLNSIKSLAFYTGIALSNAGLLDTLEARVKERTYELSKKNEEITDSIHYTKRIQDATLTSADVRKTIFPDSFVIYKPKDIISGDFFILNTIEDQKGDRYKIFILGDCTGHGVPGASLAILCSSILSQTFYESSVMSPADALKFVRNRLQKLFNSSESNSIADGMDVGFGAIQESTNILNYSGALMDCYILRDGEWITIKGDRFHVGYSEDLIPFKDHEIQLQKGDQIFLTSDGIIDQFGGDNNKKFMRKRFLNIIKENQNSSMDFVGNKINEHLTEWQKNIEQTDDICSIGIRI